MKKSLDRIFILFALGLFVVAPGLAQRQTGSITGLVLDAAKAPLPGVTVTLSGSALMATRSTLSSETGIFRFVALSPGSDYELKASLPNFKTTLRPGLVVRVGVTTEVDLVLEESPISEEVTVIAPSPVIDTQSSKTSEFLTKIPMTRDIYFLQNSVPGAVAEGREAMRMSSILGGTVRSQLYSIDGIQMNDPAMNYTMVNINTDVYEEIEFELGGHPAEVGQVESAYINIVTKSGGNKFSGGATAYFTDKSFGEDLYSKEQVLAFGVNPPEKYSSYNDLALNLGGPIMKNKIWFFVAGRWQKIEKTNPYAPEKRLAALGVSSPHFDDLNKEWMGFAKLTFQITPHIKFTGSLNYNNVTKPNYYSAYDSSISYDYLRLWKESTPALTGQLNIILDANTYLDIRGTYVNRPLNIDSKDMGAYTYYDNTQKVYWGKYPYNDDYIRRKISATASVTRFQDDLLGANHEIKAGIEFGQDEYHRDLWEKNPYYSYWQDYANRNPYYLSTSAKQGQLSIKTCPNESDQWDVQDHARRFSAYLQDSAQTGRLTLNFGLRFDYSYQYEPPQGRSKDFRYDYGPELLNPKYASTPNILLDALIDQIHNTPGQGVSYWDALYLTETKRAVTFKTLSPRLGIAYDVFGNGKTAVKASFSSYYEAVWTSKYNAPNIFGNRTASFRWTDVNGNMLMDLPSDGDIYALTSYAAQDPNFQYYIDSLKAPRTNEWTVTIEQEVAKDFRISGQFIYKAARNIVENIDMYNGYDPTLTDEKGLVWLPYTAIDPGWDGIFANADDRTLTVYGLRSDRPTPTYMGINPPEAKRDYWAAILSFDKRMSNRWQLKGSILYSRFKGNVDPGYSATEGESAMFDSPNTLINSFGSVIAFDQPLQVKIMGTYVLPANFFISGYFQLMSGSGWGRSFQRIYFPTGFGAQSTYAGDVKAEPLGSRWNPSSANLDLRVEKQFDIGGKYKFSVYVDCMNLAGNRTVYVNQAPYAMLYSYATPPYQTLSTTYKAISSVDGVRSIRLGARVSF
jgi:hypothetical protein